MKDSKTLLFSVILAALLIVQGLASQGTKEQIQKMHQDPKAYIAMLESPERMAEQKPDEVIAALGLKQGEAIADIGAGSGLFAFRFAPHVGSSGRIYAVDINSDMILYMNRYIRDKGVKNVVTVLSPPDDPLLHDASIDRFFICNTWHHVPGQAHYVALMKKMLRPGGQIIVVDYKKEQLPVGPPPEMKTAREDVIRQIESGGFKLYKEHTFLPYQYFLVFTLQ
jgi:ubiquinone/menaquinone biosynthesis C-methylase UbiE